MFKPCAAGLLERIEHVLLDLERRGRLLAAHRLVEQSWPPQLPRSCAD
jgi:hypothetical protein